jgi:hypothetical protein
MSVQGGLSVERMCRLADVSRAGLYRSFEAGTRSEDEVELRSVIQEIVLEHHQRYGYRRVAAELRRPGIVANHKRVARMMREDNLLGLGSGTDLTIRDPLDGFEVHLNLAARLKLSGPNQLWRSPMPDSYITPTLRLKAERVVLFGCAWIACIIRAKSAPAVKRSDIFICRSDSLRRSSCSDLSAAWCQE